MSNTDQPEAPDFPSVSISLSQSTLVVLAAIYRGDKASERLKRHAANACDQVEQMLELSEEAMEQAVEFAEQADANS